MLPELDVYPRRDTSVLMEDDFNSGPQGWAQLLDIATPRGVLTLDSEITYGGSAHSLMLSSEDYPDSANCNWGSAVALKRMARPVWAETIYADIQWTWGAQYGRDTPRFIEFGIDQADQDGQRRYFRFRWHNYDEDADARIHQWKLDDTSGFVSIAGADMDHGYNENKRNLHRLEFEIDLANNTYAGLRVNGLGFGSLATVPNNSLRAYAPTVGSLPDFANGLNLCVNLRNCIQTSSTRSWMNIAYAKVVAQ
jgi:hypothetical protein